MNKKVWWGSCLPIDCGGIEKINDTFELKCHTCNDAIDIKSTSIDFLGFLQKHSPCSFAEKSNDAGIHYITLLAKE